MSEALAEAVYVPALACFGTWKLKTTCPLEFVVPLAEVVLPLGAVTFRTTAAPLTGLEPEVTVTVTCAVAPRGYEGLSVVTKTERDGVDTGVAETVLEGPEEPTEFTAST